MLLSLNGPKGPTRLELVNVAWCPDILCNLVSFRLLRQQGIWWDTKGDPTALKRRDDTTIADLIEAHGQWVLEHRDVAKASFYTRSVHSRTKRSAQKADAMRWHKRLGHPGPAVIEHLVHQCEGVRIKGITTVQCNACGRAKTKRQIRRTPRTNYEGPGERLAIDFHSYEDASSTKEKSQMLTSDRYSGFLWDFYFKDNRTAKSIIFFLDIIVRFLKVQYNITVKVIECDGEIATTKPEVGRWCTTRSIRLECSAPDTQAQNGGAERSGGVIKDKSRTIRLDANLPWEMWPEIVRAAVYLHNRTPNYNNGWKSPYEVFFTAAALHDGIITPPRKPNQAHLKVYGCKAFALTDDTLRGKSRLQRLDPRAWIGYLVGYRSSNIYRIWIPSMGKVISTRDVVFDEDTVFDGRRESIMDSLMHSTMDEIASWIRTIELPTSGHGEPETQSFYEDDTMQDSDTTYEDDQPGYHQGRKINYMYPSPPATPPPVALLAQLLSGTHLDDQQSTSGSSTTNPWQAAFMAGTQAGHVGTYSGEPIDKAKMHRMLAQGLKPHESELPPPPSSHMQLESHPLCDQFKAAEKEHLESHSRMKSWSEVPSHMAKLTGQQILDCMWVYTYKLDKDHRLVKCKARLVVRGDQQRNITSQDTYAATLASRSFRLMMAIAAHNDLELKQFDVTNAFVHASMDREVYMRMPLGCRKPGTILRVNKALYGLRISPSLWQKHFTSTLKALGFQIIPHEPCCMVKDGIFIFFYVDDIILAYDKRKEHLAHQTIDYLRDRYMITGGNDLQWFLGMEVMRDRQGRRVLLSQAAYADKISRLADKKDVRHDTPMAATELKPREGLASASEINRYQRKIGSLLFAAVTTRPDIAFATSRLARFLMNPGAVHHEAADRVLLYLYDTRWRALELGGGKWLEVASDASFADNTLDRKSSQGYTIKLFGGLIAWKASKQDTVTTSTTEAELLALSQVAKEAIFTSRLLNELGVRLPDSTITIHCDNTQTISLINKEISKLQTKLRHVDIHNHWLRQEVARGVIRVEYVPSSEMLADGFTKVLPANRWAGFMKQLGLVVQKGDVTPVDARLEEMQSRIEGLVIGNE